MAQTAAIVDIYQNDNGTLQDAFQFGDPTDTSWTFTGVTFKMEVKASRDDVSPLLTLTTAGGQIVTDDVNLRVIHLNVADTVLQASLPPATYVYDLVMIDGLVRTVLMQGLLVIEHGVTED